MSYHQFQMFEKIGTEESQIETSIELSEIVNLFIKQNTYTYTYIHIPYTLCCYAYNSYVLILNLKD